MANLIEIIFRGTNQVGEAVDGVKESLGGVQEAAQKTSGAFDSAMGFLAAQEIQRFGDAMAGVFTDMIAEAGASEDVMAQLNAVLKSTGGAAGVTAESAGELADSLSKMTRFEDDAIVGAENLLLTFTSIGKDIFPDATKTVLDMSQALGQDLKSSAIQLGKALNDPINGVTALQRVGVQFTDAQKDMIKSLVESGDLMGAQKIILQELQKEFGGSAEAAGKTFAGSLDRLGNAFKNLEESMGKSMTENKLFQGILDKSVDALNGLGDAFEKMPAWAQTGIVAILGLGAGLAKLAPALISARILFGGLGGAAKGAGTAAAGSTGAWASLRTAIMAVVGSTAAIVAFAAVVSGVLFNALAQGAASAGKALQDFLGVQLPQELQAARDAMMNYGPFSMKTWQAAYNAVKWGLGQIWSALQGFLSQAGNWGEQMVQGIWQGIQSAWDWLASNVETALDNLLSWVQGALDSSSPSKVWANKIGLPMAQGIAVGFQSGMQQAGPAIGAALQPAAVMAGGGSSSVTVNGRFYSPLTKHERSLIRKEQQRVGEQLLLDVLR